MKSTLCTTLLIVALATASGNLLGVDTDLSPPSSGEYAAARKAIAAKDWNSAIKSLKIAAQGDSRNPDIHNLLGYAYRNAGQVDLAFQHYHQALKLDPRHRGAHEYVGEAYLMSGNLAKAEEHLAALAKICGNCEERADLARSIERYKAGKKSAYGM